MTIIRTIGAIKNEYFLIISSFQKFLDNRLPLELLIFAGRFYSKKCYFESLILLIRPLLSTLYSLFAFTPTKCSLTAINNNNNYHESRICVDSRELFQYEIRRLA